MKSTLVGLVLLLSSTAAFADGRISGQILDSKTGDPLTGVIIAVKGTALGTVTDIDGNYTLEVPAGSYELEVRYLGYTTKAVSDVAVKDDAVVAFNSVLTEESKSRELGEVVIRASLKKESVNALYVLQKNNVAVSSGISADVIAKSPDRSTGEVLKRVSGASVQNNKFVIVRGLSDRYNIAMLNGALMPSTEPDRKAFSFDVIPSNLIDNLIINKTASADLPGDFAGGVIQVLTRDVPEENFLTVGVGAGYNSQSTGKDFISNGRSTGEYFGFGNRNESLPAGFGIDARNYKSLSQNQQYNAVKSLPNNFGEKRSTALPPTSLQASLGDVRRFKNGGKLGTVIGVIHRLSETAVPNFERAFYEESRTARYTVDSQWRFSSMLAGLANISYVQGKTKISFKNLYNKLYDNTYYRRNGYNTSNNQQIFQYASLPNDRQIFSSQLEAEQVVSKHNIRLNGNLNFSSVTQDQQDLRTASYARSIEFDAADKPVIDESVAPTVQDRSSRRFFSSLTDRNYGGSVSAQLPFKIGGRAQSVKAGYLGLYKTRDFSARIFQYDLSRSHPAGLENQAFDQIFVPQNVGPDGFALDEITQPTGRYSVDAMLNAGYVLFDNAFGEKWRLSWGGRFEHYSQRLLTQGVDLKIVDTTNTFADFLPSFNLAYNLSEEHKFRLSGSRTVNRPEFREIAPFAFLDLENLWQVSGNPALKRGLITNADVRYEWYPNPGEMITVGGFYKYFETPIEVGLNGASNADLTLVSYTNAKAARSFGLELDVRKSLSFIADQNWAKNTTMGANFTYVNSKVDLSNFSNLADRPLQGQSPYLLNFSLLHTAAKLGMSFSVLYNRVGERIALIGNKGIPDTWERSRDVLDISISKTVLKTKGEFKLTVSDLFNQPYVYYWNTEGSGRSYQSGTDRVFQKYQMGTTVSLGFGYRFGYGKSARSPVEVAK
jgi:TonB-dependent receptor